MYETVSPRSPPPRAVLTWLYAVGYFLRAASVSKLAGSLERMSAATSSSTSSLLLPPDEEERAWGAEGGGGGGGGGGEGEGKRKRRGREYKNRIWLWHVFTKTVQRSCLTDGVSCGDSECVLSTVSLSALTCTAHLHYAVRGRRTVGSSEAVGS